MRFGVESRAHCGYTLRRATRERRLRDPRSSAIRSQDRGRAFVKPKRDRTASSRSIREPPSCEQRYSTNPSTSSTSRFRASWSRRFRRVTVSGSATVLSTARSDRTSGNAGSRIRQFPPSTGRSSGSLLQHRASGRAGPPLREHPGIARAFGCRGVVVAQSTACPHPECSTTPSVGGPYRSISPPTTSRCFTSTAGWPTRAS